MSTRTLDESLEATWAPKQRRRQPTPPAQRYRKRLLWRALLMVAALLLYSAAELLAKLTLVVHWTFAVAMGRPSSRLLSAGDRLSVFIYQLWRFLLFCQDAPPWPLDRWAHSEAGDRAV